MGIQTTVYLRGDELKQIEQVMTEHNLKRHQVLKLALRSFLFPTEKKHPINGYATIEDKQIVVESEDKTEPLPPFIKKTDDRKEKTIAVTY